MLVRLGLGGGFAAGHRDDALRGHHRASRCWSRCAPSGAERLARRAAPFLVIGPAAIWQCVSADGMFAAFAAWGLACLAIASVRRSLLLVGARRAAARLRR